VLEDEVLALDPAQTLQRVDERRPGALLRRIGLLEVCRGQVADPIDLPGLLAVSRERGQQKTLREQHQSDQPHERLMIAPVPASLAEGLRLGGVETARAPGARMSSHVGRGTMRGLVTRKPEFTLECR